MTEPIPVTRPSLPPYEEYCAEIRELWDSRWLTNGGVKHQALEAALRHYLGAAHLALFTNGHLALENLLQAFGLRGEIITTPFTFASTTQAIVRCGCTPVFCDVDPVNFTLDPGKLEEKITARTAAILPVHVYGSLCNVEAIDAIARKHGLPVIYDAAHAFGVSKDGISAACFGDAAMFSFHATKVFHSVEGGLAVCREEETLQRLREQRNFGLRTAEEVVCPGGNGKMSEFAAAMGLCNLRHLEEEIGKRRLTAERYRARLEGVPGLRLRAVQAGVRSNYAYFPVVFDGFPADREEILRRLAAEGIHARRYFYPLTSYFACFRDLPGFDPGETPVAAHLAERVLCLPLYADLTPEDADRICDVILRGKDRA